MKTLKTSMAFFILTIILFGCNSDGGDPPNGTSSYYVEADVAIEGQEPFHFKNAGPGSAINIKVEVSGVGQLQLYGNDEVNNRQFLIMYNYYELTDPTVNLSQSYQLGFSDSESIGYVTESIIEYPTDCYGNFTITNETVNYLEGTFSFKGIEMDQLGNFGIKAEITNGKFKIKKTD